MKDLWVVLSGAWWRDWRLVTGDLWFDNTAVSLKGQLVLPAGRGLYEEEEETGR